MSCSPPAPRRRLPPIDGLQDGHFWTNKEAIWKPTAPPASLVVIGAGAIGIEFAQIYARFGTTVTVLEALPHILPLEDDEAAASLVPALQEDGITLHAGVTIERAHQHRRRLAGRRRGARHDPSR